MKTFFILLVRAYQVVLSPLFRGCCRFEPSCSNYAIEAFTVHGAFKGLILTVLRLLRCRPFGDHGYDPVPPKGTWKRVKIK
jgi:putative membrane protein insertion efficiency factor